MLLITKMKQLLIDLLKIHSVSSDINKLHEIVNYVENYFKGTNTFIEKFEFNNKPSIVIKNFEWKKADIVLNWHLDVVPPSEDNQFAPIEKDGKLYARWAGDMKAGDAIMIKLMKDLLLNKYNKKKISLILTTDEEVGSFDWAEKLTDLWYLWDVVLIPDGGSLEKIVYAEKWIIHLDLEFYGLSAHASRPWLGENAIDNMIKFYNLLRNYIQNDKKLFQTKDHWWSSVNLNIVNWWAATNVLPDKVNAKIDIRITEEINQQEILQLINKFLEVTNWELKNILVGDLLYTDPSNKHIQRYLEITKKYVNEANLVKEHWWSDGRFFSKHGCVVILHKPRSWNLHGKKEFVVLEDLDTIYNIYKDFILSE